MKKRLIPLFLFAGSGVLFAICAVLQFCYGQAALGVLFTVLALIGFGVFVLLRSGRVTW